MTHSIPPLLPPDRTPRVRTVDDLHRHWSALMGELGFGARSLWMALFDADGRPLPTLPRMDEVPRRPDRRFVRGLLQVADGLQDEIGEGATVAFLLSRPGRGRLTDDDLAWAAAIGGRASSTRVHPLLVATDEAILVPPIARAAA